MSEQTSMKYPGKITPKKLGFNKDYLTKLVIDDKLGAKRDLFIVQGAIMDKKTGVHDTNGPWVKFLGDFIANDVDGAICRAPELCLPNVISPILENVLNEAKRDVEGVKDAKVAVEIELEIGIERTEATGKYSYTCKNLKDNAVKEDARALAFMALMNKHKKLDAPAKSAPGTKTTQGAKK